MSSSKTDQLVDPLRPALRLVVNNVRSGRNVRRRISLASRKFGTRDHGLRHFRIR